MNLDQIRSLTFRADFDVTNYAAGMAQKVAADKAGAASGKAVAASVSETQTKVSQAGDVLSRLSRQYVDGYASAQKMATAVNQLSRGIETGKIQMTQAGAILDGIARKYGAISTGAEFAARGQTEFAQAIAVTNSRLTAQTIAATHAGTASARLNVAANQNRLSGGQLQGLGYQANDVVTMALMGASPGQIAVSQGGQILQTLQMGEGGLSGSLNAIKGSAMAAGASIAAMLGPIGLIAAGFAAVGTAAGAFYLLNQDKTKTLEELLKDQAAAVRDLGNAYGEAAKGVQIFATTTVNGFNLSATSTIAGLKLALANSNRELTPELGGRILAGKGTGGKGLGGAFIPSDEFKPFGDAIAYLAKTAETGTPDILTFRKMVEDRWALDPNNDALTKAAGKLEDLTKNSVEAAKALRELEIVQNRLFNDVGSNGRLLSQGTTNQGDMDRLSRLRAQQEVERKRGNESAWADMQRMTVKSPQEIYAAARRQEEAKYVSGEDASQRADRIRIASTTAYAEAEYRLIEAHKQRTRALEETLASSRLDLELIGKTTGEQAALRMEFEKTQELRQQAAENGIAVDQKELDLIHQKAVEYGKLADAIQKANLLRDIQFEREQLMRSPGEQAIASRLRGTGFGMNSDVAGELRYNQEFAEVRDGVRGFLGDISDALVNGGDDIGKALAQAILGGLNKILDKILDDVLNSLANSITSAIMGNGPGQGIFAGGAGAGGDLWAGLREVTGGGSSAVGRFVGGAGSGAANFGAAANQNMTGDISQWAAAIRKIESSGSGGYSALGPITSSGDRAYGAYQVMGNNVGPWTQKWLGDRMSPGEFLHNSGAQDRVFAGQFGSSVDRHGLEGGVRQWFTGSPTGKGSDQLGTSGDQYFSKFTKALGSASDSTEAAAKDIGGLGKVSANASQGLGQFGNMLSQFPAAPAAFGGGAFGSGGGGLASLFGGGGGPSFTPWELNYFTTNAGLWAKGGAFQGGNVIPFARGGIVNRPTLFPMANGAGLMGEAGPEAVMPLRRGANGSLGVAMHGGGASVVINSVINNNAGVAVSQEQRKNADGSIDLVTVIEQVIADKANRPGTLMAKALDARGARQQLKRVG